MIKNLPSGWIVAAGVVALMGLAGCGSDSGMSAKDEAALKAHDASQMKIPAGAKMQRPANYHSSIADNPSGASDKGGPAPAGAAPGAPPAGGGN